MEAKFGEEYRKYENAVPRFVPKSGVKFPKRLEVGG